MAMKHHIRGVSLIELMVALTISLIITAAVATIFVNTKKAYSTQERLSRVQENGRFAMQYLLNDLRMAGYMGCWSGKLGGETSPLNFGSYNNFHNALDISGIPDFSLLLAIPVEGLDRDVSTAPTAWSPSGDTQLPASMEPETDALAIRTVDIVNAAYLTVPMAAKHSPLQVNSVQNYNAGDIVLVTDCSGADLFQVTGISGTTIQHATGSETPGNSTPQLRKEYGTDALDPADPNVVAPRAVNLFKVVTRRYFIRQNPNGVPSLYMDENGGAAVELVEGIEDMQVLYGVDTDIPRDTLPNTYVTALNLGDSTKIANVVSVRIGLLARTPAANDSDVDNNSYNVNGKETDPKNDRNQRRVFLATVKLRNQGLP